MRSIDVPVAESVGFRISYSGSELTSSFACSRKPHGLDRFQSREGFLGFSAGFVAGCWRFTRFSSFFLYENFLALHRPLHWLAFWVDFFSGFNSEPLKS